MSSRSERRRSRSRERKDKSRSKRSISPEQSKVESTPQVEVTVNSNGEATCSIEETNKLRLALGLKPLKVEDPKEKEKNAEQQLKDKQEAEKHRKILEIGGALEKMKKKRQLNEKLVGATLGTGEETEDVSSWVRKSRALEVENLKKEKELAEKRARELDNQDAYTEKDLKGLKVGHTMDNFTDESEIILTLKDTNVLADANNINEDEGELESIKLVEKEKLKKKMMI